VNSALSKSKSKIHVVLDRDGTLINHVHYLSNPEEVSLLPGVLEGIHKLQLNKVSFSLHTNQSGVGRKYFSLNDVKLCNDKMFNLLNLAESAFHEICIAPEAPDESIKYRKPSPNFGNQLIKNHNYEAKNIFYIGDTLSDFETSINLGCNFVGVDTGLVKLSSLPDLDIKNIYIKKDFLSAVDSVLELI
jgi:D-glycero-D-manno-heptose 1,7-bisphosphate phosphatase